MPATERTKNYARTRNSMELPSLIKVQLDSFRRFREEGLAELFDEISPIESFNGKLKLYLPGTSAEAKEFNLEIRFKAPEYSEDICLERDMSFASALYIDVALVNYEAGEEVIVSEIFLGDFPLMTGKGTFIINGTERVVVSQLIRSPGVYADAEEDRTTGRRLASARLIPDRGAWMEFETRKNDYLTLKFNRKRTVPVTILLRALAAVDDALSEGKARVPQRLAPVRTGSDDELLKLFEDVDVDPDRPFIANSIRQEPDLVIEHRIRRRDTVRVIAEEYGMKAAERKQLLDALGNRIGGVDELLWPENEPVPLVGTGQGTLRFRAPDSRIAEVALIEFYKRMRPGDPPTLDNAREYLYGQLFDQRRYDLERVGRYKLNQRLQLDGFVPVEVRTITRLDIVRLIERMIAINNNQANPDDIDHLGNRRLKTVGELIQNKMRVGLRRTERVVKERMSIRDSDNLTPVALINIRPIVASIREFFGSSQLSQFMEQTNPLAELTHKRTLSALGPGGLRRERAGFDVRDVHHSHYGRICPIETPEGPNIGLIGRLASYGSVNEYGFVETPYRKVIGSMAPDDPGIIGRYLGEDVEDEEGLLLADEGERIDSALVERLARAGVDNVPVRPFVTNDIIFLSADEEDRYVIAQANAPLDERSQFADARVSGRHNQQFAVFPAQRVDYMDVAPRQIVGISAALIPFLEHDDANRALMGSNMQRQAVPLLNPDVPLVSTGMEGEAVGDSGQVMIIDYDGEVIGVQGDRITIRSDEGELHEHRLRKYNRSNQSTCIDQRPVVFKGQQVTRGMIIADSSSTDHGNLALGHDVLAAFLSWDGGNYEDALLVSEDLLRDDKFTSIHIEKHELEARDTKLGAEEITYDIPNVAEDALKDLDEEGIIRIGAEVGPNDILVGKITPKGEKELSPEEKLLRAIFGEKAREVKDSSLRLPHGDSGKVVDVKTFTREEHRDLPAGVEKMVRVSVAQKRKLTVGDKMAGRHGNKGVISKVVPVEDMPYLSDGRPVEIILNPLGVPGRMNIGQVLEIHLGWAAERLGFRAITPVFDGAREDEIQVELGRAWLIDHAWKIMTERALEWVSARFEPEELEDDDEIRRLYVADWLRESETLDRELLLTDRDYARRVVLEEWLREGGHEPDDVLMFETEGLGSRERARRDDLALDLVLRLWMEWVEPDIELPGEADSAALLKLADQVMFRSAVPVPLYGKQVLYDGRTGEPFDRPVTVGMMNMLKLAHLVEDKVHARSTGPYSLVTQQPLGGKAQFGGQRFGEMEVWALEAYGAAYTLQEMLTVKSDDVQGRVKTYEAIVKGEAIEEPGIPTSFRVLVKELQSLGLAVQAIDGEGEPINFGKEDERTRQPRMSLFSIAGDIHRN
ncbi:MAG: DNA-directed RNA polymerase subunit beta [Anaerolineaceae bacterium]|nr:DNA-directed RNA polymerase subunit beta [Anaerolineaceae bacterium]